MYITHTLSLFSTFLNHLFLFMEPWTHQLRMARPAEAKLETANTAERREVFDALLPKVPQSACWTNGVIKTIGKSIGKTICYRKHMEKNIGTTIGQSYKEPGFPE